MSISARVRAEVMERDKGECQFFCGGRAATEIAHFDHQGAGGLPEDHWPNLAAACGECHSRIHADYVWTEFDPVGLAIMRIRERGHDEEVPSDRLWFYARHIKAAAERASQSLQTVGSVDHIVGQMMHDLRDGAHLLEAGATFDRYVAMLGWDSVQANEIADTWEWAAENGGWPEGVPFAKVKLIHDVDFSLLADMSGEDACDAASYLGWASSGASYSDISRGLIKSGLKHAKPRVYLVVRADVLAALGQAIRTRDEDGLIEEATRRGLGVLNINSFKGLLQFKRGKEAAIVNRKTGERVELMSLEEWRGAL